MIPTKVYPKLPRKLPASLGFSSYSLRFGGAQYVDLGDKAVFDFGTGDWVIMGYGLFELGGEGFLCGKFWASWHGYYIGIRSLAAGSRLAVLVGDGGAGTFFMTDNVYNPNQYHAFAYGRLAGNIFIQTAKERKEEAYTAGAVASPGKRFMMGRRDNVDSPNWLTGNVPLLMVYNTGLSPQQIEYNFLNYDNPIRDGLVCWLPMEEGVGETVFDKSGFGNHGTLLPAGAGPTWERLRQWELRAAVE